MSLVLSESERAALLNAAARERRVRQWRRYQAVRLVADGKRPEAGGWRLCRCRSALRS
ncbi:MAG: hypothetical protein ACYDAR_11215 [Thermomicrobiales bacterium]